MQPQEEVGVGQYLLAIRAVFHIETPHSPGNDDNSVVLGDCRKMRYQIEQGELRSNERLGQEPKTGAQAKQGQRSAGIARLHGMVTAA